MDISSLEKKLNENYNHNGDYDESIARDVLEYMGKYPVEDLPETNVAFMKSFSKNCSNLIDKKVDLSLYGNPSSDFSLDQLKWIYRYIECAIKKLELMREDTELYLRYKVMYSHLFTHNSRIAKEISDNSENLDDKLDWLMNAYHGLEKGIDTTPDSDAEHRTRQYSYKAELDISIGNLIKLELKSFWLKKAYADFEKALGLDTHHIILEHMGEVAKTIAKEEESNDNKISWFRKSLDDYVKSGELNPNTKQCFYGNATIAGILYELSELAQDFNEKVGLLERACELEVSAGRNLKTFDPVHSMMCFLNAGKYAYELYELNSSPEFRRKTIENYSAFLKRSENNPVPGHNHLHSKISVLVKRLKDKKDFAESQEEDKRYKKKKYDKRMREKRKRKRK